MIESVRKHMPGVDVKPLAMDQKTFHTIYGNIQGIEKFQYRVTDDLQLQEAQKRMSHKEFCWLMEVELCRQMLKTSADWLVYVDADQWFTGDLRPILEAIPDDKLIALSPHYFPPTQEHREKQVGRYNFGIGAFRPCDETRAVVDRWFYQALEDCGEKTAGHQRLLDKWPRQMIHELPPTVNCGPWSLPLVFGDPPKLASCGCNLFSYHFHEFRPSKANIALGKNPLQIGEHWWNATNYDVAKATIQSVYLPYRDAVEEQVRRLNWSPE